MINRCKFIANKKHVNILQSTNKAYNFIKFKYFNYSNQKTSELKNICQTINFQKDQKRYPSINRNNNIIKNCFFKCAKYSFCSNNKKEDPKPNEKDPEKPLSYFKQIKATLKKYGRKGLLFYACVYLLGGTIIYFLIKEKYIDVNNEHIKSKVDIDDLRKKYGEFKTNAIVALIVNELLEIPRLAIVIGLLKLFVKK